MRMEYLIVSVVIVVIVLLVLIGFAQTIFPSVPKAIQDLLATIGK